MASHLLPLSESKLNLNQTIAIAALILFLLVRWLHNRFARISISSLPGPPKTHWLFGNLSDLNLQEVGVPHFSWQEKYGAVFQVYGWFGDRYLMTSDPKAIQHIYSNSSIFGRLNRELVEIVFGPGIVAVIGDDHKRHRRVVQSAFGPSQLKDLFPVFSRHCDKLVSTMRKEIEAGVNRQRATINVYDYAARASLDIIGEAAFDYQFGALDNKKDDLRETFRQLQMFFGNATKLELFLQFVMEKCPPSFVVPLFHLPIKKFASLHAVRRKLDATAKQLVQNKIDACSKGLEGGKDLMSLLVRANEREDPKRRLSDVEVRAEIASITTAGRGTTASTTAFALWELAKDLDLQHRIRQEISHTLHRVKERGETEIKFDDYEDMSLLVAFIKEVLRYHPVAISAAKQAMEDTVIPLSHPVKLKSGRIVSEIPILKGQQVLVNIPGYNRSPEIFGSNPHEFNVDRWLNDTNNEKRPQGIGIYAGLITFAQGSRACIGWRFLLLQMQMTLINLISTFEFTVPEGGKVLRTAAGIMVPTMEGNRSAALLLDVSIL